jgi:hypothetical protein
LLSVNHCISAPDVDPNDSYSGFKTENESLPALTYTKRLPLPKVFMDYTKKPLTSNRISEIFSTQDFPKKSNQKNAKEK